jgi:hypothetical protein
MVMVAFHDRFYHSQRAKFTPSNRPFSGKLLIDKTDQQTRPPRTTPPPKNRRFLNKFTLNRYIFLPQKPIHSPPL